MATQLTKQQIEDQRSKNAIQYLKESGEIEKTEDEEPIFIDLDKNPNYIKEVTELSKQIYLARTPDEAIRDHDRLVKAEDLDAYQGYETVKTIEFDSKVESSTEIKIGNTVEIVFNQDQKQSIQAENTVTVDSPTVESFASSPTNQETPSALSEFTALVDFGLLGKKAREGIFGLFKGLFGGLKESFSPVLKAEKKKPSKEEQAKIHKKAERDRSFFQASKEAMMEAKSFAQDKLAQLTARLGVSGMGAEGMNSYMGQNRNLNSREVNTYTVSETARSVNEAQKIQKKRIDAMKQAETGKPAVNMQGMAEGGTAGGKANISSVASAG